MKSYMYWVMSFNILIFSVLMIMNSKGWINIWVLLEFNTMGFILMLSSYIFNKMEESMKYFMIQLLASIFFLLSIFYLMVMNMNNMINIEMPFMNFIFISSLMLKMGMPPFHFWYMSVLKNLSNMELILIMSWQKIPILLLMIYMYMNKFLFLSMCLGLLLGVIIQYNQILILIILIYSSIVQMSWFTMSLKGGFFFLLVYMLIYMIMLYMLIKFLYLIKSYSLSQSYTKMYSMIMCLLFLSMGGMPPMVGFLMKWLILEVMMKNFMSMSVLMVIVSILNLYIYVRIFSFIMMKNGLYMKMGSNKNIFYNYLLMLIMPMMVLLI